MIQTEDLQVAEVATKGPVKLGLDLEQITEVMWDDPRHLRVQEPLGIE